MSDARPIDLSCRLEPTTPVYPGDPNLSVEILESTSDTIPGGRRALNNSSIRIGMHCGTHMDAPFHFFENGITIDQVPLDVCVGQALLIDLRNEVPGGLIEASHLKPHEARIREIRRVVLHTGWSARWGAAEYFADHPAITEEAGRFLQNCGARLVGVDFPSVDRPPYPVHLIFLGSGMVIVENLANLAAVKKEIFNFIVLPLKLTGRDGSPVRAVALEGINVD